MIKIMKVVRQTLPGAWICTNDPSLNYPNHGRKSVQHNKIYLQDGDEFEIELYNPMSENVLAVISLDGKPISSSGIVIRAGQRFYLDCFYDDKKKFVFKTYEIDGASSEVQEAIAKNGLFEVQFFKEKILKKYEADTIVQHHHHHHYNRYPYWNGWYGGFYYVNGTLTNTGTNTGTTTAGTVYNNNSTFTTGSSLNINTTTSDTYTANLDNLTFTASNSVGSTYDSLSDNANETATFSSLRGNLKKSLKTETGQVDKGSASSQNFTTVDMDFEDSILNKISYQLLPESRQPLTVDTLESSKIRLNGDIEMNGTVKINGKEVLGSKVSQLLELKAMLETKLITQEEFEVLKTELLS